MGVRRKWKTKYENATQPEREQMRAQRKKSRSRQIRRRQVTVVVLIIAAIAIPTGFHFSHPFVALKKNQVTIEAGDAFDPWAMVRRIHMAEKDDVSIDTGGLCTILPGEYQVSYTLNGHTKTLDVTVQDTVDPKIYLSGKTFEAAQGDQLVIGDFIDHVEDGTAVTVSFADGATHTFREIGKQDLTLVAVDAAGNRARKTVEVDVSERDMVEPVISGVEDVLLNAGDDFDVFKGISAEDDKDGKVKVTADCQTVDTSEGGNVQITYQASDTSGNTASVVRNVMIAQDYISFKGKKFPVYWNTEAVGDHEYLITVNRLMNTVTVYRQDEEGAYTIPDRAFVCSVGDHTPTGYFRTEERYRWKDLFENSWGQYATRIVDHILFHSVPYYSHDPGDLEYDEYNALGTSASLGCVRLSVADAKWIYDNTEDGFPCVIYDDSKISGPLGKPEPLKIDTTDELRRGWDPTDPDEENPWDTGTGAGSDEEAGYDTESDADEDAGYDSTSDTDGDGDSDEE